jgi:AraC-like DNA-binding protein
MLMLDAGQLANDPVNSWSAEWVPARHRHDAWSHVLGTYFLPWSVTSRPATEVLAQVRQRPLGDCRYVECASGPISGQRTSGEIGRTRGDYFNLLYVVSGMEVLRFEGREILLPNSHFVLWDSGRRMGFQVLQNLAKLTLIIPARQMHAVLPNAEDYVGVPIMDNGGMRSLFTDHLRSLRREIWNMKGTDLDRLRLPTLDLLARAYATVPCRRRPSARQETLRRVREYLLAHLGDGDLTSLKAAEANRISIRYLHLLFKEEGVTAAQWIRDQRIARCKFDLSNPQLAGRTITQIAYGWGFNDIGHFGKVFRRSVGMSPGAFRRQALTEVPGILAQHPLEG